MKTIDGKIRKIEPLSKMQMFFDFEFWAESDDDTYGLLCLVQKSRPNKLFIVEMNDNELSISDDKYEFEAVKERISRETGITDLAFPKVLRFKQEKNNVTKGFQAFLKSYQKPVPIYKSIFNPREEAVQIETLSIEEFQNSGGEIVLLGDLRL